MKQSMVIYYSFYEAILDLPPKNQLEVFNAICKFGFTEEEPELTGISNTVFKLIRPQLEANNRKAAIGIANGSKGADYGHLGGRPSKEKPPRNPQETPIEGLMKTPKEPSNVNDNNNDNVNKNNNENDNLNANENEEIISVKLLENLDEKFSVYVYGILKTNAPIEFKEEWQRKKSCYYRLVLNSSHFHKTMKKSNVSQDVYEKMLLDFFIDKSKQLDVKWTSILQLLQNAINYINKKIKDNGNGTTTKPNAKNTVAYIQQQQMREPARDFGEL